MDACECGLSSFSLMTGHAWQWEIPHELRGLKSINYLEFLTCITGSLLNLFECGSEIPPGSAELNIGDNASSLGWLQKSNFADNEEQASHSALACFHMGMMASHTICQCSQWFAGTKNNVADLLSREFSSSDSSLTHAVSNNCHLQIPPGFCISPLPPEITSMLDFWVQHKRESMESPPPLIPRLTPPGNSGLSSSTAVSSSMTLALTNSTAPNATHSSEPLLKKLERKLGQNPQKAMQTWLRDHAMPLSMVHAWPSSQAVGTTPLSMKMARLQSFYNGSSEDTKTMTPPPNTKKQSH